MAKLICPDCGSDCIQQNDNLHSIYQCRACGFQGDGAEFDPEVNPSTISTWLRRLMGADWVERNIHEVA